MAISMSGQNISFLPRKWAGIRMFKFPAAVFRRLSAKHRCLRSVFWNSGFFQNIPPFSWPAARIDTEETASTRFKGVSEKGIRYRGRHFVQTSVIVYFYVYFGDTKNAWIFNNSGVFWFGGAEESRTPVRRPVHKTFYERSRCFSVPSIRPPAAGSGF